MIFGMARTRISVTVDESMLREIRELAGSKRKLSSIVEESLQFQLRRMRMTALLDEMDARQSSSPRASTPRKRR